MTVEVRPPGRTGIHVSRFGLGTMVLGNRHHADLLARAGLSVPHRWPRREGS